MKDEGEAQRIAMESCDVLLACGYTKPLATLKIADILQLLKNAVLLSTILKIKSELDQFVAGIEAAGVLSAIRNIPIYFPVFSGSALTTGESVMYNNYNLSSVINPVHKLH